MAEIAVSFLLDRLRELIIEETRLILGVEDPVRLLRDQLEWMHVFLRYADDRRRRNDLVKIWVTQVRDVAYDAEDVIDKFVLKAEQHRQRNIFLKGTYSIHHFFSQMGVRRKIQNIRRRTEEIYNNRLKYGIEDGRQDRQHQGESSGGTSANTLWERKTSIAGAIEDSDVVSFEVEAATLASRLIAKEKRRAVISIVGMGGSGKTALAAKVYNNIDVKKHFDCRAWIYMSKKFRLRNLLEEIIKRVVVLSDDEVERVEKMNNDELARKLREYLKNMTYLVVIDDIWSTSAWDNVDFAFPNEMNGSRVLLTTRREDVAIHADARTFPHKIQLLSQEASWNLFCKKVFPEDTGTSCPPYLEQLGKEIVARCDGLPIALVVLGGLLFSKAKLPSEWAEVLWDISQPSTEGISKMSRVFDLSYRDLPYHLKLCFLYCSLFPEDHMIPAKKLIQLWVAEGFAQPGRFLEEVNAEEYLEELVRRSIIQVIKRGSNGKIKTCRIHHIMRELSVLETKEDKFLDIHGKDNSTSPTNARCLSIQSHIGDDIVRNCSAARSRTLLCFTPHKERLGKDQMKLLCTSFKLLRVMDLEGVLISMLPDEIGKLIHLRYLGLRSTFILELPSSMTNLRHVQTLDLRSIRKFMLPKVIQKMQRLTHLYVDQAQEVEHLRIGRFRSLKTLSMIAAGSWIKNGELSLLTNLRKLGIFGDLNLYMKDLFEAITKLYRLQSLKLEAETLPISMTFSSNVYLQKLSLNGRLEKLLSREEFPPSLTKLTLNASELKEDPLATLAKLPNLRVLRLQKKSYVGMKMVCLAGWFSELEVVELQDFPELEEWMVEEGAMQMLGRMVINECPNLMMLPVGLQSMCVLQELEVKNMPTKFKERLDENREDWHKISHIHSRHIR